MSNSKNRNKLVILTLAFSRLVSQTPHLVTGLLLIEIGQSFGTPVGITGQLGTIRSILGIVTSIVMGVVSVRFNHKSLLIIGCMMILVSALGSSLDPSFLVMGARICVMKIEYRCVYAAF